MLTSDVMITFMYLLPLVTSRSPTKREPESGETIPVSMLIVVLFPAPLWPSNTVISLVIAENDNPSTARLTSPFQGLHNWFMGRPRTVHRPYGSYSPAFYCKLLDNILDFESFCFLPAGFNWLNEDWLSRGCWSISQNWSLTFWRTSEPEITC